jgi:hypothetical protein
VSRQHAFIQLRADGRFYLRNIGARRSGRGAQHSSSTVRAHHTLRSTADARAAARAGRRVVLVNNAAVESGQRALLPPDCLLEIGGLRLLFMPNRRRVREARQRANDGAPAAAAAEAEAEAAAAAAADEQPAAADVAAAETAAAAGAEAADAQLPAAEAAASGDAAMEEAPPVAAVKTQ